MNMIVSDSRPLHYMAGRVMFNSMYLRPQIYSNWKEEYGNQVSADIIQAVEDILKNFTDKPFSAEDREIFTVKIEQLQQKEIEALLCRILQERKVYRLTD